jgi:hypothetical protein
MLPTQFRYIWPNSFRGEEFFKSANQKQESPVAAKIQIKFICIFNSPCQRQGELLPSLGVHCPLTFHILIFSSETPQPNELKVGRALVSDWLILKILLFCNRLAK